MLTIGRLARLVGVSTKTIRVYHAEGPAPGTRPGPLGLPALHRPGRRHADQDPHPGGGLRPPGPDRGAACGVGDRVPAGAGRDGRRPDAAHRRPATHAGAAAAAGPQRSRRDWLRTGRGRTLPRPSARPRAERAVDRDGAGPVDPRLRDAPGAGRRPAPPTRRRPWTTPTPGSCTWTTTALHDLAPQDPAVDDLARRIVEATRRRYGSGELPGQAPGSEVPRADPGRAQCLLPRLAPARHPRPRRPRRGRMSPWTSSGRRSPSGGDQPVQRPALAQRPGGTDQQVDSHRDGSEQRDDHRAERQEPHHALHRRGQVARVGRIGRVARDGRGGREPGGVPGSTTSPAPATR